MTPLPPPIPPYVPTRSRDPLPVPLGGNPEEQVPITGLFAAAEAILRQPRRVMFQLRQQTQASLILSLLVIATACALIYGLVVGTFSGADQLWASPVKIASGLLISALICLPSLYIFSCLSGSKARLVEVFGLVAGLLTLMTVLLIGFAPVAWVFSQSTKSVVVMATLHLTFWFIATYFGLRFLHQGFKHLSAESDSGLKVWVVVFILVMLQMTTALRPLVGKGTSFLPSPDEKKFFLSYWGECLREDNEATPAKR